jgi:glycosyltransferase 2 family protein
MIVVITVIIFYTIFMLYSDFEKFSKEWTNLNLLYLPIIFFFHFLVIIFRTLRQKSFFDLLNFNMPFKENLLIHISGLSLIVTPGGMGQIIKSYYLKKKFNTPYTTTSAIVVWERFHDIFSAVTVISIMLIFIDFEEARFGIIGLMGFLVLLFFIIKNKFLFESLLVKLPKKGFLKNMSENAHLFHNTINQLNQKNIFLYAWMLSVISTLAGALGFYFSFIAFNLDFNFTEVIVISYLPIILGALSFIPGGVGITEVGMLGLLMKYGIELSLASALVFFSRLSTIWFFTIMGIIVSAKISKEKSD